MAHRFKTPKPLSRPGQQLRQIARRIKTQDQLDLALAYSVPHLREKMFERMRPWLGFSGAKFRRELFEEGWVPYVAEAAAPTV